MLAEFDRNSHDAEALLICAILECREAAYGQRVDGYWVTYHERRLRRSFGLPPAPRRRGEYARNRLLAKLKRFAAQAEPITPPELFTDRYDAIWGDVRYPAVCRANGENNVG